MNRNEPVEREPRLDKVTRENVLERLQRAYVRYRRKKEKTRLLNEYCGVTGITRKHAIVQMHGGRQRGGSSGGRRGRPVQYDRRLAEPLQMLWRAAGYCCAELLHAARERLLQQLTAHGRLALDATCQHLLLRMSSSTLKRYLRTLPGRRLVRRRPRRERALRARVPLSVLQPKPCAAGTFECDLVEHNGGNSGGEYIYTIHMVDVVTAWRYKRACMGKHRRRIMAHLQQMLQELPYTAQVLDTDNDTAFMNDTVVPQLERHGIRVTRSRAYKKNDNAHVEQKAESPLRTG